MDSKVKFLAGALAFTAVTVVLLIVLYINGSLVPEKETEKVYGDSVAAAPAITVSGDALKDFLKDEDFFDPEPAAAKEQNTETLPRLYLQGSSIVKDIRLSILDENGMPAAGYPYFAEIEGLGEYKDLDQDGIIYIPDLSEGEYLIDLKPVPGYVVPADPLRVSVRAELQYKVIDDISLYIKSEDEIDPLADDTALNEANEDTDETEVTGKWEGTDAAFGIDVSKWQKDIDWEAAAADGVEFAIIRCGYRGSSSGSLVEDPYFKKNIDGARAAGIQTGVYFFTQAITEVEAVEEASMTVSLLDGMKLDLPVFIDTEGSGGRADALDKETRTAVCKAFCETVRSAGYAPGIYASRSWFDKKLIDDEFDNVTRWLAEYRKTPLYTGDFGLWQYTSKGTINGIGTRVDLDMIWNND